MQALAAHDGVRSVAVAEVVQPCVGDDHDPAVTHRYPRPAIANTGARMGRNANPMAPIEPITTNPVQMAARAWNPLTQGNWDDKPDEICPAIKTNRYT